MQNSTSRRTFNWKWVRFIPAVIWMTVIFISSSRSGGELNSWLPWVQQWIPGLSSFDPMHYVSYFILGLAVAYGLGRLSGTWPGALLTVAICTLYGVTDEWHQSYVPMRTPDALDLQHDAIGAAAASLIFLVVLKHRRSRNYTIS
ncbi:VanZ family protein [Cohnella kolymensis]|uniref:VanZ family protein n=1 Tax=Cohnella kolymensis TaxID=1590652 RepID=UPI0006961E1E|nr:VanZ family protein [Cohnella kolymensis]